MFKIIYNFVDKYLHKNRETVGDAIINFIHAKYL